MNELLNENFLIELFKLCLKKEDIINVCLKHLKYQYLPSAEYKEIWKQISNEYTFTKVLPTIGVIFQNCKNKPEVVKILEKIRDIEVPNEDSTLKILEGFIKDSMCIEFYDSFQEIYSQGNKESREKARQLLFETSDNLHKLSLKSEYCFSSIFGDFQERQYQKKINNSLKDGDFDFFQPVLGIDEIDFLYPIKKSSVVCGLAQSGVGKTTQLVFTAIENARRGAGVLYVTSEGTKEELEDRFDACWSAVDKFKIERGDLTDEEISFLSKTAEKILSMGGEVELHVITQFGTATILDIYNLIEEYKKLHGRPPHVLCIDYLELFTVHDKHFSTGEEKARRQAVARAISNLVTSQGILCCFTATQASNVPAELSNSEEFVLTREYISGDKNLLDSFSLFYSLNQTLTEYNNQIMRIYIDKARHSSKKKQLFNIATNYENGSFYNRKRSLNEFCTTLI